MRTFKVGGLRFVQIGRLSLSFCIRRQSVTTSLEGGDTIAFIALVGCLTWLVATVLA
jgi:hypothetical protein